MPPENVDEDTGRFYSNLAIPAIHGNRPNLLLHNLNNNSNPNAERLFEAGNNHRLEIIITPRARERLRLSSRDSAIIGASILLPRRIVI